MAAYPANQKWLTLLSHCYLHPAMNAPSYSYVVCMTTTMTIGGDDDEMDGDEADGNE
jgi:hypothetical protein